MKKTNQQRPLFIYLRAINIEKMKIIIELKKIMKRLINKLFEWLGYKLLSKKEYDEMNLTLEDIINMIMKDRYAFTKICGIYQIREDYDGYMVMLNSLHAVKFFPFGDDKEYARLCSEELCEMLNQKI